MLGPDYEQVNAHLIRSTRLEYMRSSWTLHCTNLRELTHAVHRAYGCLKEFPP